MKQITPRITAMLLAAAVCGCVSSQYKAQEQAAQQAEQQAAQKQAADAALRAEHVKQNWSKLQEGLTFDQVEQLVGPFDEKTKEMESLSSGLADYFNSLNTTNVPSSDLQLKGKVTSVSSTDTVIGEHYILTFEAGKLKSWKLR